MTVIQVLDASTAHLTQATRNALDAGCLEAVGRLPAMSSEHGWLVSTCVLDNNVIAPDLEGVIALARSKSCSYILFDRDADVIEGLPVFE